MTLRVGDRVQQQARSTTRPAREGVIREVVHSDPSPRYRISWDDGHESVCAPTDGSLKRVEAKSRTTAKPRSGAKARTPAKKRTAAKKRQTA
jgi:hypothetical protein